MRKSLLVALCAALTQTGHAQSIGAGTIAVGGSLGYSRTSSSQTATFNNPSIINPTTYSYANSSTTTQFTLAPTVGYFVADNFAVGAALSYNSRKQKSTAYQTPGLGVFIPELDPSTALRVGLYAQYYKLLGEHFGLVGTLGGGYQRSTEYGLSNNLGVLETKGSGYYADLTPGIVFFPIPRLGVSASVGSLGFNHFSYDYPSSAGSTPPTTYENEYDTFSATFGLSQLLLGGTYYFGR